MDKEYIVKIINGECTPEERKRFFEQVVNDDDLAKEYARVKNKYMIESLPYKPGTEDLSEKHQRKGFLVVLTRIAAILCIPLLAYFFVNVFSIQSKPDKTLALSQIGRGINYYVNNGVKAFVVLPDSTIVWLNSGSRLDIPDDFSNDNRKVSLSGEGYFSVKPDSLSPFVIATPNDISVHVTGTEFNLSCYDDNKSLKLTLYKGKLKLIREKTNETITVKPNEEVVLDYASGNGNVAQVIDKDYAIAWKNGNLRFDETPLDEVIKRLERWYGVHIAIDDDAIMKYTFTADFESESIKDVLDFLKMTTDISYDIKGNDIRLFSSVK